jgi:hypothetical protein
LLCKTDRHSRSQMPLQQQNLGRKKRRVTESQNSNQVREEAPVVVAPVNLQNLAQVGKSAQNQQSSSIKIFHKFLQFMNLPGIQDEEFENSMNVELIGKYADYLLKVEKFSKNTSLSYMSNLRGELDKLGISIFEKKWYNRLRGQIKLSGDEACRKEGISSKKQAEPMSVEELANLSAFMLASGDHEHRCLLILQYHVMGRIAECACCEVSDLSFNKKLGSVEVDWSRSKTVSSGKYNIFPDAISFERDFIHSLGCFFLISDHISSKLFPNVPETPSAYMNKLLKNACEQLELGKTFQSHSARKGAPTHVASDPGIQPHWIAERGSWLLDNINRVFLYISPTSTNDARVARSLSSWADVNKGGQSPYLPRTMGVTEKDDIISSFFGPAAITLNRQLLESMAASLLMYLEDVKKYNIVVNEKIIESLQSIGYEIDRIKQLSLQIRNKFVVDNILNLPAESPLLEANDISQIDIQIPFSSVQERMEQHSQLSSRLLCSKFRMII